MLKRPETPKDISDDASNHILDVFCKISEKIIDLTSATAIILSVLFFIKLFSHKIYRNFFFLSKQEPFL